MELFYGVKEVWDDTFFFKQILKKYAFFVCLFLIERTYTSLSLQLWKKIVNKWLKLW